MTKPLKRPSTAPTSKPDKSAALDVRLVVWHDANSYRQSEAFWEDLRGVDLTIALAVSVGLVIRDDQDQITLVSHFFHEEDPELFLHQTDGQISIPRGCIVKQYRLATYRPGPIIKKV